MSNAIVFKASTEEIMCASLPYQDLPVSVACVAYKYSNEFTSLSMNQSSSDDSNSLYARMTAVKLIADKLLKESCQWASIEHDDLNALCENKPAVPAGLRWHILKVSELDTSNLPTERQWVESIVNSDATEDAVASSISGIISEC